MEAGRGLPLLWVPAGTSSCPATPNSLLPLLLYPPHNSPPQPSPPPNLPPSQGPFENQMLRLCLPTHCTSTQPLAYNLRGFLAPSHHHGLPLGSLTRLGAPPRPLSWTFSPLRTTIFTAHLRRGLPTLTWHRSQPQRPAGEKSCPHWKGTGITGVPTPAGTTDARKVPAQRLSETG